MLRATLVNQWRWLVTTGRAALLELSLTREQFAALGQGSLGSHRLASESFLLNNFQSKTASLENIPVEYNLIVELWFSCSSSCPDSLAEPPVATTSLAALGPALAHCSPVLSHLLSLDVISFDKKELCLGWFVFMECLVNRDLALGWISKAPGFLGLDFMLDLQQRWPGTANLCHLWWFLVFTSDSRGCGTYGCDWATLRFNPTEERVAGKKLWPTSTDSCLLKKYKQRFSRITS